MTSHRPTAMLPLAMLLVASSLTAQHARYDVRVGSDPRTLSVRATVPARDSVLTMTPWGYPPSLARGRSPFAPA